jgi:D-cysteine desulfhydrase
VLATAVHGRAVGFPVTAVVVPRPDAPEVQQAHQATLAQECRLVPASSEAAAVPRLVREWWRLKRAGHRPYFLPPGGSSPLGAVGYVRAMEELARQHEHGELPSWPDVIVCVLGSGATFAGLVAGTRAVDRPCRVLGVGVWSRPAANRPALAWMARSALRLAQPSHSAPPPRARELAVDLSQLGDGYGHATPAARDAQALFAHDGITLEGTYTGKAAAALVALARGGADRPRRLLFWHSHSSAPLAPLLRASASAGEPGRDRTG